MAILLCEVPLNKDTQRERERKRGKSSSRTITGTYYTYESIFAEVASVAFWVVSASPKSNTTHCSCPHHQLVEVTVALAVGPLVWAMPAEVVCMVWRCSLSTWLLLCSGV